MIKGLISKIIFLAGAKIRNPSLNEIYSSLKASEFLSRDELTDLQLLNTKNFLSFVEKNSPYYMELFKEYGFSAESIRSINDIERIPTCDKKTLIDKNKDIHTRHEFYKLFEAETSGTSGAALKFMKDERWDSTNRAAVMRSYDWYNVKLWETNGYLWGFNTSLFDSYKIRFLDFLQNRKRLFNYQAEEMIPFINFLRKSHFLTGYSSMIYELAKTTNKLTDYTPADFKNLKLIKGTSESILEIYKKEVLEAFGIKMTSEYGAAESGLIAFECPEGQLHINIENIILETNEHNEAIVTNLVSRSFPIIRYNLGDIIELELPDVKCLCGRSHPIIKSVSGRKGASIYGYEHKYPALTFYYVFKYLAVEQRIFLNYRAFQKMEGFVEIRIEQQWERISEERLKNQLTSYFKQDLEFDIKWGDILDTKGNKKIQSFNTTLE